MNSSTYKMEESPSGALKIIYSTLVNANNAMQVGYTRVCQKVKSYRFAIFWHGYDNFQSLVIDRLGKFINDIPRT